MQVSPRAIIDHTALRHNLALVGTHAPNSRIWAVVKADGYGHGMVAVAHALAAADGLAVARVGEALRLREAAIAKPILVMEGPLFVDEAMAARDHRLELVLHRSGQIALLERTVAAGPFHVWIKVDTGMHRLGLDPEEVSELLGRLAADPARYRVMGLMTHLANADDPDDDMTQLQCERLRALDPAARYPASIGNSAGILAFPVARTHWVRPGIMLYGSSPLNGRTAAALGLRPVMTLQTRLIAVRLLRRGDAIGYGGTYVCPEDMPVGVAAIGYGDGYPRHAPAGTPVLVKGKRAPLVGRVSMDMINIDLRAVPDANVGDPVTLWGKESKGEGLPVDEIAHCAGTISYELLCRVASRVRMEHRDPDPGPC